jgi:hypothetical protein
VFLSRFGDHSAISNLSLRATGGSAAISFLSMRYEIASVVSLPRNDIIMQPLRRRLVRFILQALIISVIIVLMLSFCIAFAQDDNGIETKETWWVAEDYAQMAPKRIAVLPMENFSLEPDAEEALYKAVYSRLTEKGYIKISRDKVQSVMKDLGIQTAGQLSGISPERLGKLLNCDAVFMGRIDQSGTVHLGVYDALVVSCSLKLVHCKTGKALWLTEQWRAAHRQWQADPINLLLNIAIHENASRADRVTWLVSEMLKTLPAGPVQAVDDNLLEQAAPITVDH